MSACQHAQASAFACQHGGFAALSARARKRESCLAEMLYFVSSWMIFSSASWLLFSSASTVERRARDASRNRSRSTSLATAEAASCMAVTALSNVSSSRSSMGRILHEAVPLVVGHYSFRRLCSSLSLRYSSSSAAARHFSLKIPAALLFSLSSSSLGRRLLPPSYFA